MTLSIIVAMTKDRVIGKDNQLPWHLSEDLKRFKKITMGHPIIMGRKTYDSIGRSLPGRENIVITRNPSYQAEGVTVVHSLDEAIARRSAEEELFVIGGAKIYQVAFPLVNRMYITFIEKPFEGDTFFPEFELEKDFTVIEESERLVSAKNQLPYRFVTAERTHA